MPSPKKFLPPLAPPQMICGCPLLNIVSLPDAPSSDFYALLLRLLSPGVCFLWASRAKHIDDLFLAELLSPFSFPPPAAISASLFLFACLKTLGTVPLGRCEPRFCVE